MGQIKNAIYKYMEGIDEYGQLEDVIQKIESKYPKLAEELREKIWDFFGEEYVSTSIDRAEHDMQEMYQESLGTQGKN